MVVSFTTWLNKNLFPCISALPVFIFFFWTTWPSDQEKSYWSPLIPQGLNKVYLWSDCDKMVYLIYDKDVYCANMIRGESAWPPRLANFSSHLTVLPKWQWLTIGPGSSSRHEKSRRDPGYTHLWDHKSENHFPCSKVRNCPVAGGTC